MATIRDPNPVETARRRVEAARQRVVDAAAEWRENLDGDPVDWLDSARALRDAVDAWARAVEIEDALLADSVVDGTTT